MESLNVQWIYTESDNTNRIKNRKYVPRRNTVAALISQIGMFMRGNSICCHFAFPFCPCWYAHGSYKPALSVFAMSVTPMVFWSFILLSTSKTVVECSSCNFQVLGEYPIDHHLRYFHNIEMATFILDIENEGWRQLFRLDPDDWNMIKSINCWMLKEKK
jgi:hypothetical protein